MNVLYLSNNHITGGTVRVLLDWLRLGQSRNVHGHVVIERPGDLANALQQLSVPHHIMSMPWPGRRTAINWLLASSRLALLTYRQRIRVLHCQEHDLYPFARPLARFLRVPIVCCMQFVIRRPWAQWAFGGTRQPDALIWTSEQQRNDCADAVRGLVAVDKQYVIPMGLDIDNYVRSSGRRHELRNKWRIADDQIAIGTASAIRNRKRIHEFLDLIEELRRKGHNVVGVFAGSAVSGEQEYAAGIERRLKHLEADGVVRWLGHLEPVEPLYHGIDVFVSASEYETFGMSVCEAMACARPVAAYRGGSVAEVVGDAGLIVETGDLPALTAAVERLVVDAELRQRLGHAARQRVAEHFNPRKSFEQLVDIYESLVSGRKSRAGAVAAL